MTIVNVSNTKPIISPKGSSLLHLFTFFDKEIRSQLSQTILLFAADNYRKVDSPKTVLLATVLSFAFALTGSHRVCKGF